MSLTRVRLEKPHGDLITHLANSAFEQNVSVKAVFAIDTTCTGNTLAYYSGACQAWNDQ